MITYICKYTPVELLLAFGARPSMPNDDVEDFASTEPLLHSSVCSHARMLLSSLMEENPSDEELLLINCCDSIRRVNDTVSSSQFAFQMMLDLPHRTGGFGTELYARELKRFAEAYAGYCGHSFDRSTLLGTWQKNADNWKAQEKSHEPYIAILGARPSDELVQKIQETLPFPVRDLTCGGYRSLPAPSKELSDSTSEDELLTAYAAALLSQVPCMRMTETSGRAELLCQKNLVGIVYHSVRFCDYYSFEYADIRRQSDLPMLKIESDYTSQSEGQLSTRLQAFGESLRSLSAERSIPAPTASTASSGSAASAVNKPSSSQQETAEQPSPADSEHSSLENRQGVLDVFIGIDSGSTTTNGAAIDRNGRLLASSIIRTGARAGDAAQRVLDNLKQQLPAGSEIRRITATGYGREHISFADDTRTEISCHAKGAFHVHPKVRTIIDIGGQDSKVICLDDKGNVTNFVMNDKCAAGTGRFLEMMAHTLELDLDKMSQMGLSWKKDLTITSTCTVFAESEVVSLVAENSDTNDIIHALDKSVARKTVSMVKRVRGDAPYMMTGGVAKNQGVVKELERGLSSSLYVPAEPDLIGAIGAALYAAGQ